MDSGAMNMDGVDGGLLGDNSRGKVLDRVKLTTFKLFQLMTDKTASPTAAAIRTQRWVGVLLLSIDFIQILGILLAADFGWPENVFAWTSYLGLFSEMLPISSRGFFLFSFSIACTFVGISAAVTAYVWISAWRGKYNTIWPLKVLRVLVTTIVTFAFIPLAKVLFQPLDCEGLAQLMEDPELAESGACFSGSTAALVVLSILGIVVLVPYALFMQLVYFDDSPASGSPSCKPSGRVDAMHTVVRATLTALSIFMSDYKALRATICFILFSYLLFNVCLRLPYYRLSMSRARAAQYALFAWLSLGAAITTGANSPTSDSGWFYVSILLVALSPVPACVASVLPVLRYNQLERLARSIPLQDCSRSSPEDDEERSPTAALLSPSGASRLVTMPSTIQRVMGVPQSRSGKVAPQLAEQHQLQRITTHGSAESFGTSEETPEQTRMQLMPEVEQQNGLVALTDSTTVVPKQHSARNSQPLRGPEVSTSPPEFGEFNDTESTESPRREGQDAQYRLDVDGIDDATAEWLANAVRKYWVLESDTEVMSRSLLKPGRKDLTSLKQCDALYNAALHPKVFGPASTCTRLAYCTFIVHHKVDQFGALQQLREASRTESSIDLAFQIFKKLQAWYQNRQKEEVGAAVDSLSLIQFKKYFSEAQQHHTGAVGGLNGLWRALYDRRVSAKTSVDHDKLVFLLSKISTERKLAEKSYQLALEKFPLSRKLLRSYSLFQLHVENDVSLSKALLSRVSEIESVDVNELRSLAGQTRLTGNTAAVSDNMSRNSDSVSYTPSSSGGSTSGGGARGRRKRSRVRRDETFEVARHMVWFRLSITLLLCCSVGVFVASKNVTESFARSLDSMDSAGLRRKLTASAFYFARGMQLAALNNDSSAVDSMRTSLLKEMKTLDTKHSTLFYDGQNVPEVYDLYGDPRLEVSVTLPESPERVLKFKYGLWDLGNLLVSNGVQVAQYSMSQLRVAENQTEWRFIMDNARKIIIPAFDEAVGYYQQYDSTTAYVGGIINATLLSTMVVVTGLLVHFVFQPILVMVYSSKKSVLEIVDTVPTSVLRVLRHRYKRMVTLYARLERIGADDTELTTESKLFGITIHSIDPHMSKAAVAQEEEQTTDSEKDENDATSVHSASGEPGRTHKDVLRGLQTPSTRQIMIPKELSEFSSSYSGVGVASENHLETSSQEGCAAKKSTTSTLQHALTMNSEGNPKTIQPVDVLVAAETHIAVAADFKSAPSSSASTLVAKSLTAGTELVPETAVQVPTHLTQSSAHSEHAHISTSLYRPAASIGETLKKPPHTSELKHRGSRVGFGSSTYSIRSIQRKTRLFCVDNQMCPKDKRVRRLAVLMLVAVATLVALYATSFAVTLTIFERGQYTSAELNNAGRRRYLAREVVNSARELMVGDPAQGSVAEQGSILSSTIDYYRRVHNGLRSGDAGLSLPGSERRYPERDALMFGKSTSFEVKASAYDALVAQGVHDMLIAYWTFAEDIYARFSNPSVQRIGLNLPNLLNDPTLAVMLMLESSNLGAGLGAAVKLYKQEGTEIIAELNQQEDIILGINVAVIALLYLMLFRQAIAEVDSELRRREDVLLLLPSAVVQKTRGLKRFFVQTDN